MVLSPKFLAFLAAEKERDPRASVPELIRQARVRGIVPEELLLHRTTVWRGLPAHRSGNPRPAEPARSRHAPLALSPPACRAFV